MNKHDQPIAHCLTCRCALSWDSKYSIIKASKFAKPEFVCFTCVCTFQQAIQKHGIKVTANHCCSLLGADYYEALEAYQRTTRRINRVCRRLGRPLTDVEFARLYQQMEAYDLESALQNQADGYISFLAAVKQMYHLASVNEIP